MTKVRSVSGIIKAGFAETYRTGVVAYTLLKDWTLFISGLLAVERDKIFQEDDTPLELTHGRT